ncbi:glycosyltransferase [Photobacterium frigidiphilum]|uniref:glycosyltransferase n=1 Tax=Photobacterium frigidiphilum TaxID=264736 RepID=UPI003D12FEB8
MNKKIVFVVSALRGGGAEKFVLNLYRALEKYEKIECHIISIEKAVDHDIDGFNVTYASDLCSVSKKGINRFLYKKRISKVIDSYIENEISSDALILSNMLLSDKVMSKSKLNVYHVIHSSYSSAFISAGKKFKNIKTINRINNIYKKHPLIFVSYAAKCDFFENFKSKFDNKVIYNPVNVNELQVLSNDDAVEYDDYIIHVGRFNRAKRHDKLINAFSLIEDKKIKLLLLGDGSDRQKIEVLVKDKNLSNRVIFLGFKSNPYPYIKNAKLLILTSDFEGLPTVVIEALALNTPVVSTDSAGGIREIIGQCENMITSRDDITEIARSIDDALINPQKYICSVKEQFVDENVANKYAGIFID